MQIHRSTYNTFPNTALLIQHQDTGNDVDVQDADITSLSIKKSRRYKPSYELNVEKLERASRKESVRTDRTKRICTCILFKRIVLRLPVPPVWHFLHSPPSEIIRTFRPLNEKSSTTEEEEIDERMIPKNRVIGVIIRYCLSDNLSSS